MTSIYRQNLKVTNRILTYQENPWVYIVDSPLPFKSPSVKNSNYYRRKINDEYYVPDSWLTYSWVMVTCDMKSTTLASIWTFFRGIGTGKSSTIRINPHCRFPSWPNFEVIIIIQSDKLIILDKINFNLLGDRDPWEPSVSESEMVEILADLLGILSDILNTDLSY